MAQIVELVKPENWTNVSRAHRDAAAQWRCGQSPRPCRAVAPPPRLVPGADGRKDGAIYSEPANGHKENPVYKTFQLSLAAARKKREKLSDFTIPS